MARYAKKGSTREDILKKMFEMMKNDDYACNWR